MESISDIPYDNYIYMENIDGRVFRNVCTIGATIFHILLSLSFAVFIIVFNTTKMPLMNPCDNLLILLLIQCAFWIISQLLGDLYKRRHHFIKLNGHFEFSGKLNKYRAIILNLINLCNVAIIFSLGYFFGSNSIDKDFCEVSSPKSPANCLSVLIFAQLLIATLLLLRYIVLVRNFSKEQPYSEVERDLHLFENPAIGSLLGYRLDSEAVANLMDHYSDLIRYLKAANIRLCRQLLDENPNNYRL